MSSSFDAIDASTLYDVAIIGGGVVGCATALELTRTRALRLIVLEAEDRLAAHQTGNNSGVIHSGLYYKPGSLKARLCVEGRTALERFCEEEDIPWERCGKLVLATAEEELPRLQALRERGEQNGLDGLRVLAEEELAEYEPAVRGVGGLWVPQTGIADYDAVTNAYARRVRAAGGQVVLRARVTGVRRKGGELKLTTAGGPVRARALVNCAGLYSDRMARRCGVDPGLRIVPFRGEYWELRPERHDLVRNLIYPVPDPRFPFLGVHFTRMIGGGVEAGPNAVLAFAREGYRRTSIELRDLAETITYGGFWRMAWRHWRMGLGEMARSASKRLFLKSLQRMMPQLRLEDLTPGGAGVRAQAMEPTGELTDDFRIVEAPGMLHVLNAPSPAATASLSIGRVLAERAAERFELPSR